MAIDRGSWEVVEEAALRANPAAFDGKHIEVTARWSLGFETNDFAGAELTGPFLASKDSPLGDCSGRESRDVLVRARGVWRCNGKSRFGHLGVKHAQMNAYGVWPVEDFRGLPVKHASGATMFVPSARVTSIYIGFLEGGPDGKTLPQQMSRLARGTGLQVCLRFDPSIPASTPSKRIRELAPAWTCCARVLAAGDEEGIAVVWPTNGVEG
ncbi:MAG: hypothetical protein ACRELY_07065, partial [Polyangiaceae bacterium]